MENKIKDIILELKMMMDSNYHNKKLIRSVMNNSKLLAGLDESPLQYSEESAVKNLGYGIVTFSNDMYLIRLITDGRKGYLEYLFHMNDSGKILSYEVVMNKNDPNFSETMIYTDNNNDERVELNGDEIDDDFEIIYHYICKVRGN